MFQPAKPPILGPSAQNTHEFQTLADRGYVVFWSNPRGSAGYGEEFMTAIERDWGDEETADGGADDEQEDDETGEQTVF